MSRVVGFVSDFGRDDPYAGQMETSVAAIAPTARVIHLTHGIPPQNVGLGALVVAASAPLLPPGAVLVGVVDPGVGGERRGILVRAGGRWLVGPDNGLLLAGPAPDGIWHLDRPAYWRPDPSPTFHGRDIFAPVAAHLASYVRPDALGSPLSDAVPAPLVPAMVDEKGAAGQVVYVDRFGNLITNIPGHLAPAGSLARIEIAGARLDGVQSTYGTGAQPVALIGSWNLLEIALAGRSAAELLGVSPGATVRVVRATA